MKKVCIKGISPAYTTELLKGASEINNICKLSKLYKELYNVGDIILIITISF